MNPVVDSHVFSILTAAPEGVNKWIKAVVTHLISPLLFWQLLLHYNLGTLSIQIKQSTSNTLEMLPLWRLLARLSWTRRVYIASHLSQEAGIQLWVREITALDMVAWKHSLVARWHCLIARWHWLVCLQLADRWQFVYMTFKKVELLA